MQTLWSLGSIYPLVVPCYQFNHANDAQEYLAKLKAAIHPIEFERTIVHVSGSQTFISLRNWRENFLRLQDQLFYMALQCESRAYDKSFGYKGDHRGYYVPDTARIHYLVFQGVHRYKRAAPLLPEGFSWLKRAIGGLKELVNTCSHVTGEALPIVQIKRHNDELYPFTVMVGGNLRMVIIAPEIEYGLSESTIGFPQRLSSRAFFLTYSVQQRPWEGTFLRVRGEWLTTYSTDLKLPVKRELIGKDLVWQRLYDEAHQLFSSHCVPFARDHEDERVRALNGPEVAVYIYRDHIRRLSWDEALASVEHQWQLRVVVEEHLWERRDAMSFTETQHIFSQLLECHPSLRERKQQLWNMIEGCIPHHELLTEEV